MAAEDEALRAALAIREHLLEILEHRKGYLHLASRPCLLASCFPKHIEQQTSLLVILRNSDCIEHLSRKKIRIFADDMKYSAMVSHCSETNQQNQLYEEKQS